MAIKTWENVDVMGKRVLVRVDLNVPIKNGKVQDASRIKRVSSTIKKLAKSGAKVILLSHLGRPKGKVVQADSLQVVVPALAEVLALPVEFCGDCVGELAQQSVAKMAPGDILLLENTRFHPGEEQNDSAFAKALAENGDIYINDAFSAAHRAHASTVGLAQLLPAYAGYALQKELAALTQGLSEAKKPVIALIGGAKVSTKIPLLENLLDKVDGLVIGGAMANTFLAAQGYNMQKSLVEPDYYGVALEILKKAEDHKCAIMLPIDVIVAKELRADVATLHCSVEAIEPGAMALDLGQRSVARIKSMIDEAQTLIWNGPMGAFETAPFEEATLEIARYISARTKEQKLVSIAGGGDTVAALNLLEEEAHLSYVSMAGGAFLEWMEGKTLPGIKALDI